MRVPDLLPIQQYLLYRRTLYSRDCCHGKKKIFCQRIMLNTAYSVKAFEARLNSIKGKARILSSVDTLSFLAMVWGKGSEIYRLIWY